MILQVQGRRLSGRFNLHILGWVKSHAFRRELQYFSVLDYRAGSHSRYDLKVHVVWITKYRKKILKGDISVRIRELLREICKANDVIIVKGHVSQDHIHLLLNYPSSISVSKLVQYLKGKTSRRMLQDYTELRKVFWGQHL